MQKKSNSKIIVTVQFLLFGSSQTIANHCGITPHSIGPKLTPPAEEERTIACGCVLCRPSLSLDQERQREREGERKGRGGVEKAVDLFTVQECLLNSNTNNQIVFSNYKSLCLFINRVCRCYRIFFFYIYNIQLCKETY